MEKAAYDELRKLSSESLITYLEANGWEYRRSNLKNSSAVRYHRDDSLRTVMIPNKKLPDFEHIWDFNLKSLMMVNDCSLEEATGELFEFDYQREIDE